jgi:NAD(P)-dependent dehydrogenase (short-subunit alcohol dehydrogenase family)
MRPLAGKIAVVTGASRGAGRGIARVLGQAGATVYVTGRTTREHRSADSRAETIEETAELVTAEGERGIPVRCDHTSNAEIEALFDRVRQDQGRLDLLVNNAWGGYEDRSGFGAPFWEQPLWRWERMFDAGVRTHFVTSRFAAPLMLPQKQGLIVSTTFWDRDRRIGGILYDTAKWTINRLASDMAGDLRPHGIAAVALSPGWMRTEAVLEEMGVTEATWQTSPHMKRTESVQYIGRAVLALATDPNLLEKSGRVLTVGDLAAEYGFTDTDGTQPPAYRLGQH